MQTAVYVCGLAGYRAGPGRAGPGRVGQDGRMWRVQRSMRGLITYPLNHTPPDATTQDSAPRLATDSSTVAASPFHR